MYFFFVYLDNASLNKFSTGCKIDKGFIGFCFFTFSYKEATASSYQKKKKKTKYD